MRLYGRNVLIKSRYCRVTAVFRFRISARILHKLFWKKICGLSWDFFHTAHDSCFSILLMRDMRKTIYSFIHTKPISGQNYVLGKYITGISLVLLSVMILTVVVDAMATSAGNSYGYKTSLWDIWANIIIYDLPGILLTGCIMLFISILFKNVIPAIPAMLLYFMYANIGSADSIEGYHYQVKPGAVFVRFPQLFTETETPSGIVSNQLFLLVLAIVLLIASIQIWERRRDT